MTNQNTVHIGFTTTEELDARLRLDAARIRGSRSDVVRGILTAYYKHQDAKK